MYRILKFSWVAPSPYTTCMSRKKTAKKNELDSNKKQEKKY